MNRKTITLTDSLYAYLLGVSSRESDVQRALREETQARPNANMQIGPDQGQFMALLIQATGARRCLEIGVFTGYSALTVALALPPDGTVIACDINEEYTNIARRYWERAGVIQKIDLRIGPALETLKTLQGPFDFAFIDADKSNYDGYYEGCLRVLRSGGLIAIDNVLWGGDVADPTKIDDDTVALRALNEKIHRDERVDLAMLPIGDGLTIVRKH
ncbi:MAG: class I SAM-dependent methyltransferase [Vulcanimicrobiaceae bacterium]